MTGRERFQAALAHREGDRVPIHDGPWFTTEDRWHEEGLPADTTADEFFGYELAETWVGVGFKFPVETVEETEEYTLIRNSDGVLAKNWKHATSTPEWAEFSIRTRADWEEHKHEMVWTGEGVDWEAMRAAERRARERGQWFCLRCSFGFTSVLSFMGTEAALLTMAADPEWTAEMFDRSAQGVCEALDDVLGHGIELDGCYPANDLGYRNGPLFSPAMFRRFELPQHRRFYQAALGHGLPTILHSCGCVHPFIPDLIEAGLACLQPLEVKAGMDLLALKAQYGEVLALMGGIDVRKMAHPDPSVIEDEIRTKIGVAKVGGGYLYHSDHSIPDNVSFAQYQRVIELAKKYGSYE
jgi:uroporphyrinogen decarboxylase